MSVSRLRTGLAVAGLGFVLLTGTAAAQVNELCVNSECKPQTQQVGGEVEGVAETTTTTAAPQRVAATSAPSGTLPFTGGDVAGLVVVGGAAIAVGTVMVRRSRTES
jgi:hypothetical protein